ncbi:MAG: acireductone dioxygenase [Microcoleus sp.]
MAILQLEDGRIYTSLSAIAPILNSFNVVVERISFACDRSLKKVLAKDILTPFEKHQVLQTTNYAFPLLKKRDGYQRRDVMVLHPGSPSLYPFLIRSDRWHTHSQAEGLHVLAGECIVGVQSLAKDHPDGTQVQLLLQAGDYIKIPPRIKHRFSLSSSLNIKAVQYSLTPDGCIPEFVRSPEPCEGSSPTV